MIKYRLDIYNTSGIRVGEITDYLSLSYVKQRNQPGELVFTLSDDNYYLSQITDNCIIDVRRKDFSISGATWKREFTAIYRAEERTITNVGVFTANCPGILDLLNDRIVAYPPESVNRCVFESKPVETILHTLVKYNATSSGTVVDGRIRLATIPNLTIPADGAGGDTVDFWECAEQPLLDTMTELATKYKVAFQLDYSTTGTFDWSYIDNVDVSDSQVFSIARGNVESITYRKDRKSERTVAVIGSTGEGTLKNYDVRTGTNYNVSTNNREMYVNSSADDIDQIYLDGDRELTNAEAKPEITFTIRETDSSRYGTDFDLNYLVTGNYGGDDYLLVVSEVSVTVDSDGTQVVSAVLKDV